MESAIGQSYSKLAGQGEPGSGNKEGSSREEIDTSAPFKSVKEAVSRFGGIGYWRPSKHSNKIFDAEHKAEKVDIPKEQELQDVLKELEATKMKGEELKLELQKQDSEVVMTLESSANDTNTNHEVEDKKEDGHENLEGDNGNLMGSFNTCSSSAAGLTLMEMEQAKLNLPSTTDDDAGILAFVQLLNMKLDKERTSFENTSEKLTTNSTKISRNGLDNPLDISRELQGLSSEAEQFKQMDEAAKSEVLRTISEIEQTKCRIKTVEIGLVAARKMKERTSLENSSEKLTTNSTKISRDGLDNPLDISRELRGLSSEAEQFKQMDEAAKSEVLRTISEIEQTKCRIKTAEIAWKMKEAARAAEAVALAEIKALSSRKNSSEKTEGVTLILEEYSSLTCRAQESEELSKAKVIDDMLQIDEANVSKMDTLKRAGKATEEVKARKKALEEALNREEVENKGKLANEEALRKRRSEGTVRHSSVHNSTKFKNSFPSHHGKDPHVHNENGLNQAAAGDMLAPVLMPTLSIGQILKRKLLLGNGFETEMQAGKVTMRLGQILRKEKQNDVDVPSQKSNKESSHKQFSGKRKKFGFAWLSLLKRKRKPTLNLS